MICPNCRQDAPTISRGLRVYCTACGAPRSLLNSDVPVNVAGKPVKVGGTVAGVLGWFILLGGLLSALAVGALFQAIWPAAIVGYVIGGFIALMSLLFGLGLVFGGRKLRQTGEERSRSAREAVVFSLAARRGGSVTPRELAQSLSIPEAEADALLTEMAKRADGRVSLEVDDDGSLRYFIPEVAPAGRDAYANNRQRARVRVNESSVAPTVRSPAEAEAERTASAPRRTGR